MLLIVDTKGATHIAINVPVTGADKSLPAIAAMFEQNAVFIQKSWQNAETKKPEISITLGNEFIVDGGESNVAVAVNGAVLSDDFVIDSPEVRTSNAKAMKSKNDEIKRLSAELSHTKELLNAANERIKELRDADDIEGLR
jgi:hypothetical protein